MARTAAAVRVAATRRVRARENVREGGKEGRKEGRAAAGRQGRVCMRCVRGVRARRGMSGGGGTGIPSYPARGAPRRHETIPPYPKPRSAIHTPHPW